MEPFTPEDPLWKLMGKARPVVPRSNFTQNVVRAARQEPQGLGLAARLREWCAGWQPRLAGGVAALALALIAGVVVLRHSGPAPVEVAVNSAPAVIADADMAVIADDNVTAPLDSLDHMDALVAMEDTSALTDTELQFLLY
jgi:hypothetical protein